MYAMYPTGQGLILEEGRLLAFMTCKHFISATYAVSNNSNRGYTTYSRIYQIPYLTGNVSSQDDLNLTAEYLAKAAIKEALEEEEQELDDLEYQGIQEAAE